MCKGEVLEWHDELLFLITCYSGTIRLFRKNNKNYVFYLHLLDIFLGVENKELHYLGREKGK